MIRDEGLPNNAHASNAWKQLDGLHEIQGAEGLTDATVVTTALEPLISAQLATAFEQRTANLIAFAALGPEPGDRHDTWIAIRETITARLDLNKERDK